MRFFYVLFACLLLAGCGAPSTEAVNDLDGTRWALRSMNGHGLQPGTVITLRFDDERLYGRGGCNDYGGEYSLQPGSGFTVGEGGWTEMACLEPEGVMEQEAEYTASLWKTDTYSVQGNTLSLINEREGIVLQYQRLPKFKVGPGDLTGKTWQLATAANLAGMDLDAFTLQFDGRRYSGTTICRDYEGMYITEGDSLFFTSMSMGAPITCGEEATQAEARYTSLLSTTWQYNVTETELELYTDRGEKLVFTLVPPPTRTPIPTVTPSATPLTSPTSAALPRTPTPTPTQRPSYP